MWKQDLVVSPLGVISRLLPQDKKEKPALQCHPRDESNLIVSSLHQNCNPFVISKATGNVKKPLQSALQGKDLTTCLTRTRKQVFYLISRILGILVKGSIFGDTTTHICWLSKKKLLVPLLKSWQSLFFLCLTFISLSKWPTNTFTI